MIVQPPLELFTVEYRLAEGFFFDGETEAPAFSFDPRSPDFVEPDDDQIFRFFLEQNVGLFDPDFGMGGTFGDRFLQLIDLDIGTLGGLAYGAGEKDSSPTGQIRAQQVPVGPVGAVRSYQDSCLFVPQGSYLVVFGESGLPVEPFLRFSVVAPSSRNNLGRLLEQCCCLEREDPPLVCTPAFIFALASDEFQQNPAFIGPNTETILGLFGAFFAEDDIISFVGPEPVPEITNIQTIDANTKALTVQTGDIEPGSTWTLLVCRAADPTCCAILEDALEFPACLAFTRLVPTASPLNSGLLGISVDGFNFETIGVESVGMVRNGTDIAVGGSLVVADDENLSFTVDTDAPPAELGLYDLVLRPPAATGCPDLVVPEVFEIVPV